jgi:Preprotein translocase subunit SecB
MSEAETSVPGAGYFLLRVFLPMQLYHEIGPAELGEGTPDERSFGFAWDWRITGEREFQVYFALNLRGNQSVPEEVRVAAVGEFSLSTEPPSVPLSQFVHGHAPAILFPYVRQAVAQLTSAGPHGTFQMPPVNVMRLMEDHPYEESSGAADLAKPEIAKLFAFTEKAQ